MAILSGEVIRYYKESKFKRIKKAMLLDFLPSIRVNSETDMAILSKWEQHFQERGVPYAITKSGTGAYLRLIKERKGFDTQNQVPYDIPERYIRVHKN